jgi:hypothetical protein
MTFSLGASPEPVQGRSKKTLSGQKEAMHMAQVDEVKPFILEGQTDTNMSLLTSVACPNY